MEVVSIVSHWNNTNDIDSPTHGLDQTHDLFRLVDDEILTAQDVENIDKALFTILNIIRKNV